MLPCAGCAYRRELPGNCHIRCVFDWSTRPADIPENQGDPERTSQWFLFPLNYDPVWGPNACAARSDTADPSKIAKPNPLLEMLAMLR